MNNYFTSLIRTVVPGAISAVLAWAAARYDVVVDENTAAGGISFIVTIVLAVYYALVRFLEVRYPKFGWLLGIPKQPGYGPGVPPPAQPSPGPNPDL